jgi:segregation and condensation protein A
MEEQVLPWWKRALRAAIGGLRTGFGLFGRPQEVTATAKAEAPAAMQESGRSEPVARPVVKEAIVDEPVAAIVEEEKTESLPQEEQAAEVEVVPEPVKSEVETVEEVKAVEVTQAESAQNTEPEPMAKIEEVAEVEREVDDLELEANEEIEEPAAVDVTTNLEEVAESNEATAIEPVEETLATVTEAQEPVVEEETEVEQERASEATMEHIPEAVEEVAEPDELPEVESGEIEIENSDEPTNEQEEMTSLREEKNAEAETSSVESTGNETEDAVSGVEEQPTEDAPTEEAAEIAAESSEVEVSAERVEIQEAEIETAAAAVEVTSVAALAIPVTAPDTAPVAVAETVPVKHAIKPEDDKSSPFSIIVSQVYEGPMDLLLDLIRKQDIDIYDIPIAKITEQFLAYVEKLRASDMDMAGEFIYTASLLIHIKSKTLLPRAPSGPDDQFEDPRRELVERLLEHERFKNAAQMLQQKQMLEDATWTNPGMREFKGDEGTEPELAADTVDLVRVFREILDRARNRPVINVEEDSVTVGQMIQFLGRRLNMEDRPIALRKLLAHTHSQRALVAMFLALLELVRLQAILLRQDRLFSEIFIKKHEGFDNVMTEGFLAARDDWQ